MTGVLNRHNTEKELHKAIERRAKGESSALSVLLLDIDHFKSINDTFGHNVGDEVIIGVTKIAQRCLRDSDYLGRWGGEEFVVVLPDTDSKDAMMVANRIRVAIQENILDPRPVTVSIGCSEMDEREVELQVLVEQADKALYKAKQSGRNRVVCASELA